MIKLVRVDHRLLHGQVIFSWTKQVGTNYIIVADDKVPNDPISMMALSIAKPVDCELSIIPFSQLRKLVDENANTILITVMIEKEGSRIIEFPVEGIQVNNLKDKYELTFESDEVIELKFIGEQTTLDQLDITNAVSIDLQDCKSTGEYEVPVSIEVPDGVELEKQPTIKVKLTEKEDETDQKADKKSDSTQEKSEK